MVTTIKQRTGRWLGGTFTYALALFFFISVTTVHGEEQRTRNIPPPQTPNQSLALFSVQPGFRVELVAAEPMVMDPVAFDWGNDGRLWVVEMADYPLGIDGKGKPGGRVRCLRDTDGDGKYDKSTVFLKDLRFPTGVMAWRHGVLITAAPDLIYAEDTDGDGRADVRKVLFTGFAEGNQQHRFNGLRMGLDNWVYLANGDSGGRVTSLATRKSVSIRGRDLRVRPDDGRMDPQTGQSQFGRSRDDWGNWFGCNNSAPIFHFLLADHRIRRNPHTAPPSGRITIASTSNTQLFPISQVISHWEGYRPPGPGEPARFTSACGTIIYRDVRLGGELQGNAFTSEPVHNLVHRRILRPQGLSFSSDRPEELQKTEFLASRDSWFRPAALRTGPDGALYLADMYRIVIEHPEWIDDEEEKRIDLRRGHDKGRIYRIVPSVASDSVVRTLPKFDALSQSQLIAKLGHTNGWQRDRAQQLIVERAELSSVTPLVKVCKESKDALHRLHAMCTLDGLGQLDNATLNVLLADSYPGVRRHAIRLLGKQDQWTDHAVERLIASAEDADLQVRLEAVYTLGDWKDPRSGRILGKTLLANRDNPHLTAAVMSSIHRNNLDGVLAVVLADTKSTTQSRRLIDRLLGIAAAFGDKEVFSRTLSSVLTKQNDTYASWQFRALAGVFRALRRSEVSAEQLVKTLGLQEEMAEMTARARRDAADMSLGTPQRIAMIRLLTHTRPNDSDIKLLGSLVGPAEPLEIQNAVISGLDLTSESLTADVLVAHWPQHGPAVRRSILSTLNSRTVWQRRILGFLKNGNIQSRDLNASVIQSLRSHENAAIQAEANRLLSLNTSGTRKEVVARYHASLTLAGSHDRGVKLFGRLCASCHRIGKQGFEVGPDLSAINDRSSKALLIAMLDPNRAVEIKYQRYNVLLDDGRQLSGIIAEESSTSLALLTEEGKRLTILRDQIDTVRAGAVSLMPEGLEKDLRKQDVADLIAYLQSLGPPPKQFKGNRPTVIRKATDDAYRLNAATAEVRGPSLVYEDKYRNLGFWADRNDIATWTVEVLREGVYNLSIQYACHDDTKGNRMKVSLGAEQITATIQATGDWDTYRRQVVGRVKLPAGRTKVIVRSDGPIDGYLFDLKEVKLVPTSP